MSASEQPSTSSSNPVRLLCWNINSLAPTARNIVLKYGSLKSFLDTFSGGIDIFAIQEAKLLDEKITKELAVVDGYQSFWACSQGKKGYSGVTTYTSTTWAPLSVDIDPLLHPNNNNNSDRQINTEGRVVVTDHGSFVLVNVYVPNASGGESLEYKLAFLRALKDYINKLIDVDTREIVLCGDFNIAATQEDVHSCYGDIQQMYTEEERSWLTSMLISVPTATTAAEDEHGKFIDVWRNKHPDTKDAFTCWDEKTSARPFNQGVRIDYILATPGIASHITSCEILGSKDLSPKWSDHAAILVEFDGGKLQKPSPADRPACPQWTKLYNRFVDTKQRSILSMFGGAAAKKRPSSSHGDGTDEVKKAKI